MRRMRSWADLSPMPQPNAYEESVGYATIPPPSMSDATSRTSRGCGFFGWISMNSAMGLILSRRNPCKEVTRVSNDRIERIRQRLGTALTPEMLEIEDESHLHAGHAGARDGRGHYRLTLVSDAFEGKSRLGRHRLVFDALGNMMDTDIHALSIQALAPSEI